MRGLIEVGCVAVLLSAGGGCIEDAAPQDDLMDAGADYDAGGDRDAGARADAGVAPAPRRPPVDPPDEPKPTPMTDVPDELVGAWTSGSLDFALWEAYREGYWAGRNASPTREAMIFREDGSAKFYRYEFAFTLYEELVDCEGTVAFDDDGTFTFHPVRGRKRFYDSRYSAKNTDRALRADELSDPEWAGTRAYTYDPDSHPDAILIEVPSSAPYYWYRQR
jgi:hypothetical protein